MKIENFLYPTVLTCIFIFCLYIGIFLMIPNIHNPEGVVMYVIGMVLLGMNVFIEVLVVMVKRKDNQKNT